MGFYVNAACSWQAIVAMSRNIHLLILNVVCLMLIFSSRLPFGNFRTLKLSRTIMPGFQISHICTRTGRCDRFADGFITCLSVIEIISVLPEGLSLLLWVLYLFVCFGIVIVWLTCMTNTLVVMFRFQMSQLTGDVVLSQRLIIMSESLRQSMRIRCPSYQPRTTWNLPEIVSVCISVSLKILIFFSLFISGRHANYLWTSRRFFFCS